MTIQKRLAVSRTSELMYVLVEAWAGSMRQRSNRRFVVVAIVFFLAGCSSTPPIAFQNTSHRQTYSFNLEDLKKLQFYISSDVVAQYQDATGTKSLLLTRLTSGVATDAGPNWIKVSFREGGVDVPFIADPNQYDGRYWIATRSKGARSLRESTSYPIEFFFTRESRTKWFPEPMPSCFLTWMAGNG